MDFVYVQLEQPYLMEHVLLVIQLIVSHVVPIINALNVKIISNLQLAGAWIIPIHLAMGYVHVLPIQLSMEEHA